MNHDTEGVSKGAPRTGRWASLKADFQHEVEDLREGSRETWQHIKARPVKAAVEYGMAVVMAASAFGLNYWARHSHNIFKDAEQGIERMVKPSARPSLNGAPSPGANVPMPDKGNTPSVSK
jgi:hypothetical protein